MKNRAMHLTETCKLPGCGMTRTQHAEAQREDQVHHTFSEDGQLDMVKSDGPRAARGNSQRSRGAKMPGLLGDPIVRFLLVQKKIITPEEIEEAEKMLRASGIITT